MNTALAIAGPVVATLAGLTYATVAPRCTFWGPTISQGPGGSRKIALTFDDGPTPGTTDRVLDILAAHDARATFFVIGVNCQQHPELLHRIHAEGHQLANHSFNHAHFGVCRNQQYWEREIRRTDELIEEAIGARPAMFRPPMGIKTWHTTRAARNCDHALVTWSRRAMDGLATSSERILRRLEDLRDGDIVLLHDGVEPHAPHPDRSATLGAVDPLLRQMRQRGLSPARLDELLGLPAYQIPGSPPRAATM